MDDVLARGLEVARELLVQAPWPAPEFGADAPPSPRKARTGQLSRADTIASPPIWLGYYDNAPWVQTAEYRGHIESEKVWPLYDLILTTPDMERTDAVATALVETLGVDGDAAQKFAVASVTQGLPILIGVPREAMENARRKLSGLARTDVIRSVWDRL